MLFPEIRIFSSDGTEVSGDAIQPEVKAVIDGILVLSESDPDLIRSAFIILDSGEDALIKLSGTVLDVDTGTASLIVAADLGDRCIDADGAEIFELSIEDDRVVSAAVELEDLVVDQFIDAFGVEGVNDRFEAETILATAE